MALAGLAAEIALVGGLLAVPAPARAGTGTATVTDLGATSSFASVFDRPVAVNQSDTVLFAYPAAVWKASTATVTYASAPVGLATAKLDGAALNNGGIVVGTVRAPFATDQAGWWDSSNSSTFSVLNLAGAIAALPPGSQVQATAALGVDDAGEVVGQIAYLDAQQQPRDAGFFMASPTAAAVLVPEPVAVGTHGWWLKSITSGFELAIALENCSIGEAVLLNRTSNTSTIVALASAQNADRPLAPDGTVIGSANCGSSDDTMRLPDGTAVTLQSPVGFTASADSVNAQRIAVGNAGEWNASGSLIPFGSLLPPGSPWTIVGGFGINDGGDITAQGQMGAGRQAQHFLLLRFNRVVPPPVVNSIGDAGAVQAGANGCDTGNTVTVSGASQPECTLRAAIQAENAGSVTQTSITFALPANAGPIQPATALPPLQAKGVTLDGTTGPGGSVVINGFSLGQTTPDLDLAGTQEVLQGFQFENTNIAIRVDAVQGGDTVRANVIGVAPGGSTAVTLGLLIENSPNNLVGGVGSGDRNVISDVTVAVLVHGPAAVGNRILGNWLGVSVDGQSAAGDGFGVEVVDASGTVIGGATATPGSPPGNVIDGPSYAPGAMVAIGGAAQTAVGNSVAGNLLGLLPDGSTQPTGAGAMSTTGVLVTGRAVGTTVGGSAAGAGNIIDSFSGQGVAVDGTAVSGTQVTGNRVGTDAAGQTAYAPSGQPTGIGVYGARQTTIGVPGAGGNLVTAQYVGVATSPTPRATSVPPNFGGGPYPGTSAATPGALGTLISGNVIGPLADGRSVPTAYVQPTGVDLQGNGETLGPSNLIAFNGYGVSVSGRSETVVGNQIGLDSTGLTALPNGTGLVWALNGGSGTLSDDLVLGVPGARPNTISGNLNGVVLQSAATVQNNQLGTNIFGTAAVGTYGGTLPTTVQQSVVYGQPIAMITLAGGTLIGGDQPGMANVIAGNPRDGLDLGARTVVRGNFIGTAANGSGIPNGRDGIAVGAPSFIGALAPGPNGQIVSLGGGNVIANNGGIAVDIQTGGEPSSVLSNSVYGNSGGGIAVQSGGTSPPQTFGLSQDGAGATVAALFVAPTPPADSIVQIFIGDACSGNGAQGKTLLRSVAVTAAGTAYAALPLQPVGTAITSTVTIPSSPGPDATTSTFSNCSTVQPQFGSVSPATIAPGGTAVATGLGFAVGQTVNATLNSTPISLGAYHADQNGTVTATFTVPFDMPEGHHDIIFTTTAGGHFAAGGFTVASSGAGPSPSTVGPATPGAPPLEVPSTGSAAPICAGVLLLVIGAAALTAGARRPRRASHRH